MENFQGKRFNIYCSVAGRKLSFHLQSVSKKNGRGAACEILIPLQGSWMLKVGRIERHMAGDPEGENTPQMRRGGCKDARQSGGKGGKSNYWGEDSVELMSLHLQESNI